jgi:hypothetical protein
MPPVINGSIPVSGSRLAGLASVTPDPASTLRDIADQAQQTVNDAVHSVEQTANDVGQQIRDSAATAATNIQQAANNADNAINAIATKARQDILKLLDLLGSITPPAVPDASMGSVNGTKFYTPVDGYGLLMKAVHDNQDPIEFETHDPAIIQAFSSMIAGSAQELKDKMLADFRRRFNLPNIPPAQGIIGGDDAAVTAAIFAGVAACITASAVPIMATGVAILLVLIGIAFIYAISQGYDIEDVKLSTGSGADLRPAIQFSLKKHS